MKRYRRANYKYYNTLIKMSELPDELMRSILNMHKDMVTCNTCQLLNCPGTVNTSWCWYSPLHADLSPNALDAWFDYVSRR